MIMRSDIKGAFFYPSQEQKLQAALETHYFANVKVQPQFKASLVKP